MNGSQVLALSPAACCSLLLGLLAALLLGLLAALLLVAPKGVVDAAGNSPEGRPLEDLPDRL